MEIILVVVLAGTLAAGCAVRQPAVEDFKNPVWVRDQLVGSWAQVSVGVPSPMVFNQDGSSSNRGEDTGAWSVSSEGEFPVLTFDGKRQGAVVFIDSRTWCLWRGSIAIAYDDARKKATDQSDFLVSRPWARQ